MADEAITLTWTPARDDWEQSVRVWRRASGATRLQRIWGAFLLVLGGVGLAVGISSSRSGGSGGGVFLLVPAVIAALGIMNVTDLTGVLTRRRYLAKSPHLLLPTSVTVTEDDLFGGTALKSQSFTWDSWAAVIVLPDLLMLTTGIKATETLMTLPRRGLLEPDQWDDLIALVEAKVPLHPRSPGR